MGIDILGMGEVRWPGAGCIDTEEGKLIYSGGNEAQRGVGVLMSRPVARCMIGYWAISDRVMLLKIIRETISGLQEKRFL